MKKNEGFTLIEATIVLIIGGLVLTMLFSSLNVYLKNTKMSTTRERLALIDQQLQKHLEQVGRLPCPAPYTLATDDEDFGVESAIDCTSGSPAAGTFRVSGKGRNVRIGAVPIRSLNLPDEFSFDGWGKRITYAVTEELAKKDAYNRDHGAIYVVDKNNNSVITPDGSAHYVIISHGEQAQGAYNISGVRQGTCPALGSALDAENCNMTDAKFVDTLLSADLGTADSYDDLVRVRSTSDFGQVMPSGAVMGFDLGACPPGWIQVMPQPTNLGPYLYCRKA